MLFLSDASIFKKSGLEVPSNVLVFLISGLAMSGPAAAAGDAALADIAEAGAGRMQVTAESANPPEPSPESLPVPAAKPALPPVWSLSRFTRASFIEDRQALASRLVDVLQAVRAGKAPRHALTDARLDLAEFYMAHVLLAEGRSVLRQIDRTGIDPVAGARLAVLQMALPLLSGDPVTVRAPLQSDWRDWPDQPLWQAIAASAGARPADQGAPDLAPNLSAAEKRLATYPAPFIEAVLPGLLELAIKRKDWRMARVLARRFDDHAALRDGDSYHFLLGQAAQAAGALLVAFDNYSRASEGTGRDAHRARLALVDMGLASRSLRPAEARVLMQQARTMWRGDALAVETLRVLARLELSLGNPVAALSVFGEILINHPDHPDTPLIRQKASALLTEFYDAGAAGTIPLAEFLAGHRQLAIHYRFEDGFAVFAESFADTLFKAGATGIASREYDAVHDYLSVSRDLGLRDVAPERIDALRVKQIEALIAGGRHDEAAQLLAQTRPGVSAALRQKLDLLQARIFASTDDRAALLATSVAAPTDGYLRLMAEARFANGDWQTAREIYDELWQAEGNAFPFRDAITLLLAAHRSGDREMTQRLARAFPSLTDVPQWGEIAMGLSEEVPDVGPLRRDQARSRMDRAGRTLKNLATIEESILR